MKHLSSYKEVKEICDKYEIENWYISKDGLVNVDGDVNLDNKGLVKLPLNFGKIEDYFSCENNKLNSLEGAPKEVGSDFYCNDNKLTNLEGAPEKVGNDFYCRDNELTSLEGAPKEVGGNFYCFSNNLTNLKGAPKEAKSDFYCFDNKLTTLEGLPFNIEYLSCSDNPIYNIWKFINDEKYLQEFVEVYDVVRPGKVVILEYLNDIRKLMGKKPVKREEIPDDWEILDI